MNPYKYDILSYIKVQSSKKLGKTPYNDRKYPQGIFENFFKVLNLNNNKN